MRLSVLVRSTMKCKRLGAPYVPITALAGLYGGSSKGNAGLLIKTADSDATAAMQQFGRSLEYAPSMHLLGGERPWVM
jgi:hypothetical protein